MPVAVVEGELFDVLGLVERAEEEMLEHGVVEDRYAWLGQCALVDSAMELVVAQVVEMDIGLARIGFDRAEPSQRAQQRG